MSEMTRGHAVVGERIVHKTFPPITPSHAGAVLWRIG